MDSLSLLCIYQQLRGLVLERADNGSRKKLLFPWYAKKKKKKNTCKSGAFMALPPILPCHNK